ncbi:MAG: hypothetical protein HZC49_07130, partial [Nitrospirae bacterium]|nr:hypothetical protein [Nitrospirota bacterium]
MIFKFKCVVFKILLSAFVICFLVECAPEVRPSKKGFVPKPCLDCHTETQSDLSKQYVHDPMVKRDCEACHLRHGRLAVKSFVEREERKLCFICHTKMASDVEGMASVHTVLKKGNCLPCHNAHASENKALQKKVGNEQCLECHDKAPFERTKRHKPLDDGCLTCHAPHGSQYKDNLIKDEVDLCRSCHKYEEESFRNAHKKYPVEKGGCSGCHTSHSSSNDKLLRESVHEPLALGQCNACHKPDSDVEPLAVIAPDGKLCYTCHKKEEKAYKTANIHPLTNEGKCLSCHNPHASDYPKVTLKDKVALCTGCHSEKPNINVGRLHEPIKKDGCIACHNPHASENKFYLKAAEKKICFTCHPKVEDELV